MQFIAGGPDVPDEVIEALEDGELVIVCGAGISVPNGLPLFRGLVKKVITGLGANSKDDVQRAFEQRDYDRALERLETHYGADQVREVVADKLKVPDSPCYSTHKALLDLATTRDGALRLVTTNFDNLFDHPINGKHHISAAPELPVPKQSKWNSLVHLHGRIDPHRDPKHTNLVLTSSDFGSAYLLERWASRFVCELFNHFHVLFIGYQVGDPVMRYLMDALAAERKTDGRIKQAYAFGNVDTKSDREAERQKWQEKNVQPILYDSEEDDHSYLHDTLKKWAHIWREGVSSKQNIVSRFGSFSPDSLDTDELGKFLWAISDHAAAKHFADIATDTNHNWLNHIADKHLLNGLDGELDFVPVVSRHRCERLSLLKPRTKHLARWLSEHLHEPSCIQWIIRRGPYPHPDFAHMIREKVSSTRESSSRGQVPSNPLPEAHRKILQCLLHPDILHSGPQYGSDSLYLPESIKQDPRSPLVRTRTIAALKPELDLKPGIRAFSFLSDGDPKDSDSAPRVTDIAQVEVELRADMSFRQLKDSFMEADDDVLADFALEFTHLLRLALDLFAMCDQASPKHDPSSILHPSIADHDQNRLTSSWTILIDLTRESFNALLQQRPTSAEALIQVWKDIKYPLFRRLVLYGVSKTIR